MSFACNKPETMTTRFAPASITCARFSDLIPPMQKMGMETRCVNFANVRETNRRVIGFGGSGEDWAEADIIRPFALGGDSLFNAVS